MEGEMMDTVKKNKDLDQNINIENNAGTQFDPELVFIFIKKVIGEEKESGVQAS